MSDNNRPTTKSEPDASPGEFDFAKSAAENPRIKRRSLQASQTAPLRPAAGAPPAAQELAREAPSLSAAAAKPEFHPPSDDDSDVEINPAVKVARPSSIRPGSASPATPASRPPSARSATRPSPTSKPTPSPHGTRPATLYYSSGQRKDKEETPPMKSTPTASPASPSPTVPVRSAASTPRPTTVVDYRTNVDRQSREQKSVGGVLAILVYSLIGFFVVGAALAGYGAYVVSVQLHQQSVTVSDLDNRFSAENKELNVKLATTLDTLAQAQAQIGREQELILKQQEAINRLMAANADTASALRVEKQARADETSSLRARVRDLEYRGPTTQRY